MDPNDPLNVDLSSIVISEPVQDQDIKSQKEFGAFGAKNYSNLDDHNNYLVRTAIKEFFKCNVGWIGWPLIGGGIILLGGFCALFVGHVLATWGTKDAAILLGVAFTHGVAFFAGAAAKIWSPHKHK